MYNIKLINVQTLNGRFKFKWNFMHVLACFFSVPLSLLTTDKFHRPPLKNAGVMSAGTASPKAQK